MAISPSCTRPTHGPADALHLRAFCFHRSSYLKLGQTPKAEQQPVDPAIAHASVLDVATGVVKRNKTVSVRFGVITAVIDDAPLPPQASRPLDAHGRLLTPGFIDAHLHTCSMYPPACTNPQARAAPLSMNPDSIASYRRHMASLYPTYGVTAVRDVGTDEHYLPMLLA